MTTYARRALPSAEPDAVRREARRQRAEPEVARPEARRQSAELDAALMEPPRRRRSFTVLPPEEPPVPPASHRQITTESGRRLSALVHDQPSARVATAAELATGPQAHLWATAFALAVRKRFEPDSPLPEISRSAATAVREHAEAALPALDAEMLMRDALGEQVPVDELDPAMRAGIQLLVFASLVDQLALDDGELSALVAQAETVTAR